jgi:hypothetical protein
MVDNCSTFYTWGGVGGTIASFVPIGAGLAKAGTWVGARAPSVAQAATRVMTSAKAAVSSATAAIGARLARTATGATDDLIDVYRVVGAAEADDIARAGAYRVQPGGEGKYFFPTQGQAQNLAEMYSKVGLGGQQTLTRGQIPSSVLARAEDVNAASEGPAWFIRSPDIPSICNVTCIGSVG